MSSEGAHRLPMRSPRPRTRVTMIIRRRLSPRFKELQEQGEVSASKRSAHMTSTPDQNHGVASRLDRNIEALLLRRRQEACAASFQDRAAAAITRFAGSMIFVYLHAVLFGGWILINEQVFPFLPAFDPSLVILAMVASVEAIFISTFVMISQNRMAEADDKRADLNLQISLLAEHETTQLLTMVAAIADKLGLDLEEKQEIEELQQDVTPEEVLDTMEKITEGSSSDLDVTADKQEH